jgi:cbb3-type cytochrome oxidase subunit 3
MIRLSELVSALTPSEYAQLSLLLFTLVFVAVAIRHRRRTPDHDACAQMPLADDAGVK